MTSLRALLDLDWTACLSCEGDDELFRIRASAWPRNDDAFYEGELAYGHRWWLSVDADSSMAHRARWAYGSDALSEHGFVDDPPFVADLWTPKEKRTIEVRLWIELEDFEEGVKEAQFFRWEGTAAEGRQSVALQSCAPFALPAPRTPPTSSPPEPEQWAVRRQWPIPGIGTLGCSWSAETGSRWHLDCDDGKEARIDLPGFSPNAPAHAEQISIGPSGMVGVHWRTGGAYHFHVYQLPAPEPVMRMVGDGGDLDLDPWQAGFLDERRVAVWSGFDVCLLEIPSGAVLHRWTGNEPFAVEPGIHAAGDEIWIADGQRLKTVNAGSGQVLRQIPLEPSRHTVLAVNATSRRIGIAELVDVYDPRSLITILDLDGACTFQCLVADVIERLHAMEDGSVQAFGYHWHHIAPDCTDVRVIALATEPASERVP